jgi:hypothetical protein
MGGSVSRHRRPSVVRLMFALVAATVALPACGGGGSPASTAYAPAHLEQTDGGDGAVRITFTQEGADRTGLETARVQREGQHIVVPYAALVYDPEGKSWVYTRVDRLSYTRVEVDVDRVEGRRALLAKGPAPGTEVVTVGAVEVYGTELGIDGSH